MEQGLDGFVEFFDEQFVAVVRFLVGQGYSREEAEDAASEAMVCAMDAWRAVRYPNAWVRRVALRKVAGKRRRDGDEPRRGLVSGWAVSGQVWVDPFEGVDQQLDLERVVPSLLEALPPRQRAVFQLYREGCGASEIAELLGLSAGSVRSHLRHARARLRRELLERGMG